MLMHNAYHQIDVSGVPGSGKTVTVNEVIRSLQEKVANGVSIDLDNISCLHRR